MPEEGASSLMASSVWSRGKHLRDTKEEIDWHEELLLASRGGGFWLEEEDKGEGDERVPK